MSPGHHLLQGSILVLLAEALLPLTGIVTAAFLTRSLGAADYGLLTLAATFISWIELAINSLFSRATVKVIGDAEDWRPAGASLLRLHVWISAGAMIVCWILAKPTAALLNEPAMAGYLALFALDIPIFSLANCHRSMLVGRGQYRCRAGASASRWITRLVLIIVLVKLGFSVRGAIVGSIGASLAELAIARYYIRPGWPQRGTTPSAIWDYALPVFFSALALRFLNLGLFLFKMLGGSAVQTGIYGAAQNAAMVMPGIFAAALSPLLLSTMTRVLRSGDPEAARVLGHNAMRVVVGMLPIAAAVAAASSEIAVLLFGVHFAAAGPPMAILFLAGLGLVMLSLLTAILIACGNPSWTLYLTAPLLPAAIVGHFIAIPRFGLMGAASVTAIVTCLGALCGMVVVRKGLGIGMPTATFLRAVLLSGIVYPLVSFWPTPGLAIVVKMAAAAILTVGGFVLLSELKQKEINFFWSFVRTAP